MNALERAQQLAARLGEFDEARKYRKEAEALHSMLVLLNQQRTALQAAIAMAVVLVNNGALDASTLPAVGNAKKSVTKIADAFNGDPRTLTSGRGFSNLLRSLEKTAESVTEVTTTAWVRITSTIPRSSQKLLSRIEEIRSQTKAVQQLKAAATELATSTKAPPSTQEQWDTYAERRRQVEELARAVNADGYSPAVLDFYKKAQGEGAPLSMLTPEVKEWLEQNNIYDDLRLRLL